MTQQELIAEIKRRFATPVGGGRPTDPNWDETRLLRLNPKTLQRLNRVAKHLTSKGVTVAPLQLAALLIEDAVFELDLEIK